MAASVATGLPAHSTTRVDSPDQDDNAFWSGALGQSLVTLLQTSQYSDKDQLNYLRWFQRWILPAMGPRPKDGKPHYPSSFTHDGSPLEYSLNWKEKKQGQTIRFCMEPSNAKSGTAADRLNQQAADEFLAEMKAAEDVPGLDLTRFRLLLSETNVPDESVDEVLSKNPPGRPLTRVLIAFDLEPGSDIVAKAYFLPHLRAIATQTPVKTIVFDAIRKCNGPSGSYDAPVAQLDNFIESFGADNPETPQVFMLSNDCVVATPSSRLKVYVDASVRTLAQAKKVLSMGGKITGPTMEGALNAVEEFWCHLFGVDSSKAGFEDTVALPADAAKCVFVFEMRPVQDGQAAPEIEVKMHMHPSWFGKTDDKASQVLSSWFEKHGHGQFAARYQPDLATTL